MGPAAEADMVQLIQILNETYNVERIILSGGSMGGTGALTFTALHPELVDGVVSRNGTANLVEYERFQDAIATFVWRKQAAGSGGVSQTKRRVFPDETDHATGMHNRW